MKLIRHEYPELSFADDFDRWIRGTFRDFGSLGTGLFPSRLGERNGSPGMARPSVNLYEGDEAFHATLEIPGIKKDEVKLALENSVLTINGGLNADSDGEERRFSFSRALAVPEGVDGEKITAKLEDGILMISMPKAEVTKPLAIEVS